MEVGPPPLLGLDMDYQGPLHLGLDLPLLGSMPPLINTMGPPPQGFLSQQLQPPGLDPSAAMPPGMPPGFMALEGPPGVPPMDMPPMDIPLGPPPPDMPPMDIPLGLPPGFPPMDLPAGLPPGFPPGGFPPGFDPAAEPLVGPSDPSGAPLPLSLPQGPGRPDFPGVAGGEIGPPPSEPPPPWAIAGLGSAAVGSTAPGPSESERKRKRSGVEGLASNKNIKSGGSVTVYAGYSALSTSHAPASKGAPAPSAPAFPAASVSSSSFSQVQGKEGLARQLPEGWEMKKSRSTGKVYYVNEKLGKSQFDPPAGSTVVKAESQKKKQKASSRPKLDSQGATFAGNALQGVQAMNGVQGVVRAKDQNAARWQKWQKCSRVVNAPSPEKDE